MKNAYPPKPWLPAVPASASATYYWLCLRRPASPFLPPNPDPTGNSGTYNPMIVVDSMRFPYIEGGGKVTTIDQVGNNDAVTAGTNAIYSIQRPQPYRGGHAVRLPSDPGTGSAVLNTAYGYSEQASMNTFASKDLGQFGTKQITSTKPAVFYHTLGAVNDQNEPWDWFMFNDRDFTSVAELMFVPGCPPGLFTKQFVELPPMAPTSSTNFVAPTTGNNYTNFPVPGPTATLSFTFPPANPPNAFSPAPTIVAASGIPAPPNSYDYTGSTTTCSTTHLSIPGGQVFLHRGVIGDAGERNRRSVPEHRSVGRLGQHAGQRRLVQDVRLLRGPQPDDRGHRAGRLRDQLRLGSAGFQAGAVESEPDHR